MINRPIFIVGCGRSGSTAFFERFSKHHQLSWPTGFVNKLEGKWPFSPQINRAVMHLLDVPKLGETLQNKYWLGGGEVYPIWDKYFDNFSTFPRDMTAADVTPEAKQGLHKYFSKTLTNRRNRLMTKITGWPRLSYLHEIFPDALFIHVVRDGRAVANSFYHVHFWRGHNGPEAWQWGPLSHAQQTRWEACKKEGIALAGLNWEILVDAMAEARRLVPEEQFLEVRYEDMCARPDEIFDQVNKFCGLNHSSRMQRFMDTTPLRNSNDRYKSLPTEQLDALAEILAPSLSRHGYR